MSQIFKTLMTIFTLAFAFSFQFRAMIWFSENYTLIVNFLRTNGLSFNTVFEQFYPALAMLFVPAFLLIVIVTAEKVIQFARNFGSDKKSYEDAMQVYDEAEAKEVIIGEKLSLEELLTDDGEIPDHLLKHSDMNGGYDV